ncbi:hypothetical protein ACFL6S_04150 [Candidatus Poribacteria bacterium]
MNEWITVKEAAKRKKCTTANIIYHIKQGKLEAIKESGKWKVAAESLEIEKDFSNTSEITLGVLETLKAQLQEKDKQIEEKDRQMASLQERLGEVNQLLAMEKQEKLQLLEDKTTSRWRWFRRKKNVTPPSRPEGA